MSPSKAKTTGKTKTKAKAKPDAEHQPVLVTFLIVVVLVVFAFTMIKIVDSSRVKDYDGCTDATGSRILDMNPPMCVMPDGRSFGWQP